MIARSYKSYRRQVGRLFGSIESTAPLPAPTDNHRVLVVFGHRSGSNLLASNIDANGLARKATPLYSPGHLKRWLPEHTSLMSASHAIAGHLQQQWTRSSAKLGWRHLLLLAANGAFVPTGAYPEDRTSIIRIHREDALKQSVSFVKASQSGEWYDNREGAVEASGHLSPVAEPVYTFDPERIVRRAATFEASRMVTGLILDAIDYPVFELSYEELVGDEIAVMGRLRRFVDPNDTGEPVRQESYQKQSSPIKAEWYEGAKEWRATDQGQSLLAEHAAGIEEDLEFLSQVISRVRHQNARAELADSTG